MASATLHSGLLADRCSVDRELEYLLDRELGRGKESVTQAMRYGVLGHAQRIRPVISLRLAKVFDIRPQLTIPLAMSVELLHCASLMIDDLPCMDDAAFRRNLPSTHIQFGEATTILAAFGLVALAARLAVGSECEPHEQQRAQQFQLELLHTLDSSSLIGGQALDLGVGRGGMLAAAVDIFEMKTVPLFRLAVSAGTAFVDLDANEKALLNCFGQEFGLAFQLIDDLLDGEMVEYAHVHEKLATLRALIAPFGTASCHLAELIDYLDARVSERKA
jgi:geranylgeranyl pyrophosphate synthase